MEVEGGDLDPAGHGEGSLWWLVCVQATPCRNFIRCKEAA